MVKEETGFIPVVVGAIFVFHTRLEQMGSSVGGVEDSLLADTAPLPPCISITFFSVSVGGGGDHPDCLRCIHTHNPPNQTSRDVATGVTEARIICFLDCK